MTVVYLIFGLISIHIRCIIGDLQNNFEYTEPIHALRAPTYKSSRDLILDECINYCRIK